MSSGKRQSVLIFSVSPFKQLYLEPINHYKPDSVYAFYGKDDDDLTRISNDLFNPEEIEYGDVQKVCTDVHDYGSILAEILEIIKTLRIQYDDNLDIFINISSGTHEFAAAAMFASMARSTVAFSVDVLDYGVKECEMRKYIKKMALEIGDPEKVKANDCEEPKDEMLLFLIVLKNMIVNNKNFSRTKLIEELKAAGAWAHDPERKSNGGRTPMKKREDMFLVRHYLQPAANRGWIRYSNLKISLTDNGLSAIDFYGKGNELHIEKCSDILCERMELSDDYEYDYRDEFMTSPTTIHEHNICGETSTPNRNVIELERKGKTYRFTVDVEEH